MCNYVRSGTDWIPAGPLTYTSTRDGMRKGFTLWNLNKAVTLYRKANPNDSWLNSTCMCSGLSTTSQSLTNFTTHVPISSHSTSQHCHQSSRCAPSLPPSLPTKQASQRESEHRAEIMNNCQKMSHGMTSTVHVQHEYAFCALGYSDVFPMSFALEFSFLIGQKVQCQHFVTVMEFFSFSSQHTLQNQDVWALPSILGTVTALSYHFTSHPAIDSVPIYKGTRHR